MWISLGLLMGKRWLIRCERQNKPRHKRATHVKQIALPMRYFCCFAAEPALLGLC